MEIKEATYAGAKRLRALNVIKTILKAIRNFTGSQCKLKRRGVIWQYSEFFKACSSNSQECHKKCCYNSQS